MITGIAFSTIWVLDQESAIRFYTDKLGFEVRTDVQMGPGARFVTVGPKGQDAEFTLMVPGGPALDPESAEQLKGLIAKGVLGAAALNTDDCRATCKELSAKGVEFIHEPAERPYGVEAIFRDDSGNWFSLTQPRAELDLNIPWDGGS
jgi:catechol 2,3-dioxygenase-like lactoylglutathione lyase family enzyme